MKAVVLLAVLAGVMVLAACGDDEGASTVPSMPSGGAMTTPGDDASDVFEGADVSDVVSDVDDGETSAPDTGGDASDDGDASPPVCCDGPGDYDLTLDVDGYMQPYRLHIPPGLQAGAPVVIQLHGAGGSIDRMISVTDLHPLADEENIVVVTPFGFPIMGELGVWNAGTCCGARDVAHEEVLSALIDDVLRQVEEADPQRVYFAGQSNGAMMSYRMACQMSDRVRAIIVSAGYLANVNANTDPPTEIFSCTSYQPVSILAMHGLQDPLVAYEGSPLSPPIEEHIGEWRVRNNCESEGTDVDDDPVRRRVWSCANDTVIELITIADHGHPWPGSPPETASPMQGPMTDALSATDELWRFIQAH